MQIKNKILGLKKASCFFRIFIGYVLFLPVYAQTPTTLVIEPQTWNFGKIIKGAKVSQIFYISNLGKEPIVIKSIRAGCNCTTFEISSKIIFPRKEAKLKVAYNSKEQEFGLFSHVLYIEKVNEIKKLEIKGKVIPMPSGSILQNSRRVRILDLFSVISQAISKNEKTDK